jgi:phospholipase/carboxylesterase
MPMGPGFTWFPLTASIDYSLKAVKQAAEYALEWLDTVKANHSSVTLLGFSMGMAMATTMLRLPSRGLRRRRRAFRLCDRRRR